MAELILHNIRKSFRGSNGARNVLAGIDLVVKSGDFAVVLGPSGCGKTTLLKVIAGLIPPDTEEHVLTIDGEPIAGPGPDRCVVFQQYNVMPWLTVFENVRFGLQFLKVSRHQQEKQTREILQVVGLWDYRDEYPRVLSGGQLQRIAVARTLVTNPRVILMDEPFAALDAQTREAMQSELLQLQQRTGATIVFVTHDIAEATFLENQVYVLSRIPARIIQTVDTRTNREELLAQVKEIPKPDATEQDEKLAADRGDWLRYDPRTLAVQKKLKDALQDASGS